MKKLFLTLSLITFTLFSQAQNDLYKNLKRIVTETHPELNLQNKLIAFNVWSVGDVESREANKGFEKAFKVYEQAVLKGGRKGIVVIAINKDELSSEAVITFTKDGISKMIPVKMSEIQGLDPNTTNAVYDSDGHEIYKNLSSPNIYSSINHLITR